jgi:hypothetical protein
MQTCGRTGTLLDMFAASLRRRFFRVVAVAVLASFAAIALAQEFKPHAVAKISEQQWRDYFDLVKKSHGKSERSFPGQKLVVFEDPAQYSSYAFTQPGHPAHPAWITRKVVERDGWHAIDQIGYFAGDEAPFAELFRAYKSLNTQIREYVKDKALPKE